MAEEQVTATSSPSAPAPTAAPAAPAAPAPASAPVAAPAATIATPAPAAPAAPATPPPTWTDDWRQRVAGEDKDALKQLERFADPAALFKSYRTLQGRLSSGELKSQLPQNATPEEVTAWRKENGIPASAEDYVKSIQMPNGVVLGDADKPLLDAFAKRAHDGNWTPQQYNDAVSWFMETNTQLQQQREVADEQYHEQSQEALMAEMGKDYRPNLNAIGNMISMWDEGVSNLLFSARTSDGRLVGDHPAIVKALAQMAREVNPAATLLPVGISDNATGINDRISQIKAMQYTPDGRANPDYWKNDAVQNELRQLIEAQEKFATRAA